MLDQIIFLVHAVATFMWLGITWFVQLIYYPMLQRLGPRFEQEHYNRTMPWAIFLLGIELVTGILLLWIRPMAIPLTLVIIGLVLLVLIWLSTWSVCVPCHQKLQTRKDVQVYQQLMRANLLRSLLWTLRAALVIWMLTLK